MNTFNEQHVTSYISSKKLAWSSTTQASEQARLRKALPSITTPLETYNLLKGKYAPYTLKTLFIRIGELSNHVDGDTLNFKLFVREHALLFRNAYTKQQVGITFEEALVLIETALEVGPEQQAAKLMLTTGLRVHEALKYDGTGSVVGKGAKRRPVFSRDTITSETSYFRIYRKLAKVGLKPHDLRKLAATRLAASGEMSEADLMEIMGWSNIATAGSYLQPFKRDVLSEKVSRLLR